MKDNKTQDAADSAADNEESRLQQELATPLTEAEAEQAFADIDVERLKLSVVRQKFLTQVTQLQLKIASVDEALVALEMHKAVVFRRTLNRPEAN